MEQFGQQGSDALIITLQFKSIEGQQVDLHFALNEVGRRSKSRKQNNYKKTQPYGGIRWVNSPMLNNLICDSSPYLSCAISSATLTFQFVACLLLLISLFHGRWLSSAQFKDNKGGASWLLNVFNPPIKSEPGSKVNHTSRWSWNALCKNEGIHFS